MTAPDDSTAISWREELRPLLRLAGPIVAVQLGMRAMNTVDLMMLGRVPPHIIDPEAAVTAASIGNAWLWILSIFGSGCLLACDPLFSQAVGAGDQRAVSRTMQRGLVLAGILSPLLMLAIYQAPHVLRWADQKEELIPDATTYARVVSLGTPALLLFWVLRQGLQAHAKLRPILITILATNVLNAFANYALIRGEWGFPALGVEGSAWATTLSRWCMAIGVLILGWPVLGRHVVSFRVPQLRQRALRLRPLTRIALVGLPIGIQLALELGVFAATTLGAASFGDSAATGHQITLDLASTSFMLPMGLGAATAIRVGHHVGAGSKARAKAVARASIVLTIVVMVLFGSIFALIPRSLAGLYTSAGEAIAVAAALLPIAALFQVADGIQAVASGILRGLGETRIPMVVNIIGFWALGFPFGYWLAFYRGYEASGLWWGLVAGLGVVALGLLFFVRRGLAGRTLTRLSVD